MNTQFKKQQCYVPGLAFGWIGYAAGLRISVINASGLSSCHGWWACRACAFPHISRFLGYGRIVDEFSPVSPSHANPSAAPVTVNFYSFFSCPFCPIVLARLQALQKQMGFTLETFDLTLKPQMLLTKGIRSVPVVEVGDQRLIGNSTTKQLALSPTSRTVQAAWPQK